LKSTLKSADYEKYMSKAKKKLLKILKGDLPKMYEGKNHY
jgi:hypothetical protein